MKHRLLFAAVWLAGCSASDPTEGPVAQTEQRVAVPGPWSMPSDVHAFGQTEFVRYDGAALWSGGACSGCCTASSCGGGELPGTKAFKEFLKKTFPGEIAAIGGYCCRPNTGSTKYTSIHGTGRALDVMIPTTSGDADNTKGDKVAHWLVLHAQEIGVQLVIWDRMTWNPSRKGEKFNPYTGPIPHIDHLHVELNLDGAEMKTPFFTSGAISGTTCAAKCDGDVIVGADCARGDCAAYGARCVADPTPRCVFGACPATGVGATCVDEKTIANCKDGKITSTGDCGAFAAACSAAGRPAGQARCLSVFCMDPKTKLPTAGESCWFEKGQRSSCDVEGKLTITPCPAGQACSVIGGPHCEPAVCPATGDVLTCVDARWLSRCLGGSIVSASDCGATFCSSEGGAHCSKPPPGGDDPVVDDPVLEGGDAGPGGDAGGPAPAADTESGSGCAVGRAGPQAELMGLALALVVAGRRRRGPSAVRRS